MAKHHRDAVINAKSRRQDARADLFVESSAPIGISIEMRTYAALQQPESAYRLHGARLTAHQRVLKPAYRTGTDTREDRAVSMCLSQRGIETGLAPARQHPRRIAAANVDHVMPRRPLARIVRAGVGGEDRCVWHAGRNQFVKVPQSNRIIVTCRSHIADAPGSAVEVRQQKVVQTCACQGCEATTPDSDDFCHAGPNFLILSQSTIPWDIGVEQAPSAIA